MKATQRGLPAREWNNYLRKTFADKLANPLTIAASRQLDDAKDKEDKRCRNNDRFKDEECWDKNDDDVPISYPPKAEPITKPETIVVLKLGINSASQEKQLSGHILGWTKPVRHLQWPFIQHFRTEEEKMQLIAAEVMETAATMLKDDIFPFEPYWKKKGVDYSYSNLAFTSRMFRNETPYHNRTEATPFNVNPYVYVNKGTQIVEYLASFEILHTPSYRKIHRIVANNLHNKYIQRINGPLTHHEIPQSNYSTKPHIQSLYETPKEIPSNKNVHAHDYDKDDMKTEPVYMFNGLLNKYVPMPVKRLERSPVVPIYRAYRAD